MLQTFGGAWWERFEEAPYDLAAWIDVAMSLGPRGVVLVGHSAGGPKVVEYQAQRQDERVIGLVVASGAGPPRRLDPDMVDLARQMAVDDREEELLPWGAYTSFYGTATISAQTYLSYEEAPDTYGDNTPESPIAQIRCPLFVCYGANESFDPADRLELVRRNAMAAPQVVTALFEGANHGYDNCEPAVARELALWMDTLL
jgi:pimeloyl-ACP methyl ester carboxylesterase